jgi:hypothetical protein
MSNDSKFYTLMGQLGLSAAQQKTLVEALSEDIRAFDVRPNPPTLRQIIAASSGDNRHSQMEKIRASASSRFAVPVVDEKIDVWTLRASEKFTRLNPEQRMAEIGKLKRVGALRQDIEE